MALSGTSSWLQLGTRTWRVQYSWTATQSSADSVAVSLDLYCKTDYAAGWHGGVKCDLYFNDSLVTRTVPGVPSGQGGTSVYQANYTINVPYPRNGDTFTMNIRGNYFTATSTSYAIANVAWTIDAHPGYVWIRHPTTGVPIRGKVYIGVGGVARPAVAAYIGVNGVARVAK